MTVDDNEDGQFEGNYWYCTIEEAMEMFPGVPKDKFTPQDEQTNRPDKDHKISEGDTANRKQYRQTVKMLDLFLKKSNQIVQCVASDDEKNPIGHIVKVFDWTGPENGPYYKLGFGGIEGNTMPVAPAMHWFDLHSLANKLFRKLGRQADRQKTIDTVASGGDDDGDRINDASDGDTVKVRDTKNVGVIKKGGIDPQSLAFTMLLKDLFSYFAGNLDMLGGLGAQSETLGQDQLLSASASMRIQKMQKEVTSFTTNVIQGIMWYLWYDPNPKQRPVIKKAPGMESIAISVPFNPQDREGDYLEYNIKMEPYSMQHQTPESKMQGIRTILLEIVQPLLPMMQEQGVTLNVERLFKTISKLSNISELDDIIEYTQPSLQDSPVGSSPEAAQARSAPVTRRETVRRNVSSGGTPEGRNKVLIGNLMGKASQPSETAKLAS
jgi:hypothetical protein